MSSQRIKLYIWILGVNLFISTFTFGGGYVVVPMIRKYFVSRKKLFGEDELTNMAAIAQSAPGAIAINLSTLAGLRAAGMTGAVISCIAGVIPSFVISTIGLCDRSFEWLEVGFAGAYHFRCCNDIAIDASWVCYNKRC